MQHKDAYNTLEKTIRLIRKVCNAHDLKVAQNALLLQVYTNSHSKRGKEAKALNLIECTLTIL